MLLDTNIIIYISKPEFAEMMDDLKAARPSASLTSRVEAYGFHRITPQDMADLDDVFSWIGVLPVDDAIAARAIALRQQKNMSLGDAPGDWERVDAMLARLSSAAPALGDKK